MHLSSAENERLMGSFSTEKKKMSECFFFSSFAVRGVD